MTISYNWLSEYLPVQVELERLSKILTGVGLEVESITPYEGVVGGLKGIVVGEVITCEKHPDADKLSVTTVNVGNETALQIVCGAPNVAVGQKVLVATIGTTIYPTNGEAITMKKAKIRGVESHGMICAEDELGLGNSHDGILILPDNVTVGTEAATYFKVYNDAIIEIGLTPNHMDAQCHIGVARHVIAYLNHHDNANHHIKLPYQNNFKPDTTTNAITVQVDPAAQCKRYAGVTIEGVTVQQSPEWLQNKLKAIGVRPINNVVDITNFILHETGQPLHAFDAQKIEGNTIHVATVPEGTKFITLDEKERSLSAADVMINHATAPMCIGGVFGGLHSGVTDQTTSLFLESAVFDPTAIRKSSLLHGLRTDAAVRFEKGVDISNTVTVLKRAALLIKEYAGGTITSDIIDIFPENIEKTSVTIKYHYLKRLSGKNYHPETVKNILLNLGFEIAKDGIDELTVLVPFYKTDITIPADLVEEIMRIDGLDNVEIPKTISISPSINVNQVKEALQSKVAQSLVGMGLQEIFTNSIANSAHVSEANIAIAVKMINNLSTELDVLRTQMYETGLPVIAYNINRKNSNLQLFEFGKVYSSSETVQYTENECIAIYATGLQNGASWLQKEMPVDIYYIKKIVEQLLKTCGLPFTSQSQDQSIVTKL
jgi:phenylalanyl-tRNA synthetase beta chain